MSIKFYNTFTNTKEEFRPYDDGNVKMYVCGPTVYGPIHVGNLRSLLVFDLLFRTLKQTYPKVTYARNVTDIDDKIIKRANEEAKQSKDVAAYWEEDFKANCKKMNVLEPTYQPRATDVIKEIIEAVGELVEQGFAYVENDSVFFKTSELKEYGALSKQNSVLDGARVEISELKDDQRDFVLWKPSKPGEPYWNSPWGKGRPGWHIECSVMSAKYLSEKFDLHGGGQDLIFPHHENEQAQNIGLYGPHAGPKYWMHNAMVVFDGEKMSKSLGNLVLVEDALKKYDPDLIRFFILGTHYRHKLIWKDENIQQFASRLTRIRFSLENYLQNTDATNISDKIYRALCDDLNTPEAFAIFDETLQEAMAKNDTTTLQQLANTLKFLGLEFNEDANINELLDLVEQRKNAKNNGDYETADKIRKMIQSKGYDVVDSATDQKLKKVY